MLKQRILKILIAIISPFLYLSLGFLILSAKNLANKYILNPEKFLETKQVDRRHQIVFKIVKLILFIKNIDIEVLNLDNVPKSPVLFLANHKSKSDPLVLYKAIYENTKYPLTTFVAKIEISQKKYGTVLDLIDVVFVDRKNPRQALNALENQAPLILKHQRSLTVFPEATRVPGDKLGQFNPGAVLPAYKAHVSIVPVAIYNSEGQLNDKNDKKRVFKKPQSNKIFINFGKPMKPKSFIHLNPQNCIKMMQSKVQLLYDEIKAKHSKDLLAEANDHQEIVASVKSSFKKLLSKKNNSKKKGR